MAWMTTTSFAYRLLFDPTARLYGRNENIYYNHTDSTLNKYQAKSIIKNAIEEWHSACPNLRLEFDGETDEVAFTYDRQHTISWGLLDFVSGLHIGTSELNSGTNPYWIITDSDVLLDRNKIRDLVTFKQIIMHEIGHIIGLSHSEFNGKLMSGPPYSEYNNIDYITWDDANGCNHLYLYN